MNILDRLLPRQEFKDYDDFKSNYKLNVPERFNFAHDVVDEYAKADKTKPALLWYDDFGHEKEFTFFDMMQLSNKTANMFLSLGLKKGDHVLLILKQRPEVWVSLLALHKIGAIAIPATFQSTEKDIIYRCNAANVKMIVITDDQNIIGHVRNCRESIPTVKNLIMVSDEHFDDFINMRAELDSFSADFKRDLSIKNTDTMLTYFSSGTTGMPKMIVHDYTYPLGHIVTAKYWQQVQDGGRHLTASDSGWAKFAWGKIYGQWICGAEIVAYDNEKFVPEKFLEAMQHLKLCTFCAPPTIYRFLIKEDLTKYDLSTIINCATAGEPLNPEVFNKWKEMTGLEIREGFGQTETPVIIANFPWLDVKVGSTGKPSPLFDVDIVDENGNSCEDGVVGTIVIRNTDNFMPSGLIRRYENDDALNSESFANNMYSTGDTAWRDSEGYYWFEGRNDDIIKCSGYRIGPFEVESALLTHPSVLECAVTAVPDPVRGQIVKATIVLTKQFAPSNDLKKELQDHVKHATAPYKYPRVIEFVDELPKTSSGKIMRKKIRNDDAKKYV